MSKTFLKKKKLPTEMSLQITSMADIFMILLVFLLKNYATSISNIAPTARLSLPEVTKGSGNIKETLKVEIANDTVVVDQKPVLKLQNFAFTPEEETGLAGSSPTLLKVLTDQRSLKPEPNTDSSLLVMADQRTPYSTLKRVVASAAGAGFVDLQLVVVETQ